MWECASQELRNPSVYRSGDKHVVTDTLRYLFCWKEQEAGRTNLSPEQSVQGGRGTCAFHLIQFGGLRKEWNFVLCVLSDVTFWSSLYLQEAFLQADA